MDQVALAVDIGGTKMGAALVDPDGTVHAHQTTHTPQHDAEAAWLALERLLREVAGEVDLAGVGVGSAGPTDPPNGTVSPVNIPVWRDFPLVARISKLFPGTGVTLAGDGICAAAGEHWLGAGRGHDDLLVMVVSTGVGGGLFQRGRLALGLTGNAGHIGHMVVEFGGVPCPCGGRGCVEAYASGPSMVRWAQQQGWVGLSAVELAAAARSGDAVARRAFHRAGHALAAGIVSTAAICDLSRAVIGGGVAEAHDLLFPLIRQGLETHGRLGFLRDITIAPAALGGSAGLLGAAALVLHPARYR
jgi:glucokinase